jgi:membrane protein DedA with SNARE-associated domain
MGAGLWSASFITLGYLLGERWKAVQENIHAYLTGGGVAIGVGVLGYLLWRRRRSK